MRRALPIALAAIILPFILACPAEPPAGDHHDFPPPAGGGGQVPDDKRTDCPDIEFRDAAERCLILQTFVESRLGPYEVYISIAGGNGAYPHTVPVAAGGWKHSLVYRTGVKMLITLSFEMEKEGSKDGFCSITDGNNKPVRDDIHSSRKEGGPPFIAVCTLTTSQ